MFEIGYAQFRLVPILSVGFRVGSRNTTELMGVDDYANKE